MSNPILRTLIAEMVETYLEESVNNRQDYDHTMATGQLSKPASVKKSQTPVKSFDDLHKEMKSIKNSTATQRDGSSRFELSNSTSTTKPHSILKKSGWEHRSGSHARYGDKVVYKHPDGHTATYNGNTHTMSIEKKVA